MGVLQDDQGFTTAGMALALLLTLALIFTSAQVYRVNAAAADIQEVADAAASAAEGQVAEFMIVARVCDAVVLSLSLASIIATGLGVVALCIPPTAAASETLLKVGSDMLRARNSFAEKARAGLDKLQTALPFLAAASAASVCSANNGTTMSARYLGIGLLAPAKGEKVCVPEMDGAQEVSDKAHDEAADIKEKAAQAEEAAKKANEYKQEAFRRDCGDDPAYCMSERARNLANMSGAENPLYSSMDAWSFSVALKRTQSYYAHRNSEEQPHGSSVDEQVRSVLRSNFYQFAQQTLAQGYVHETPDSFDANFPVLPRNTEEMRTTTLYTDDVYPVTSNDDGTLTMHAWSGCPHAQGFTTMGSISHMEHGNYKTCEWCQFSAESLGKVASASTSINNGFEFHYGAVARAAAQYQKARKELEGPSSQVKKKAGDLIHQCLDVLRQAVGERIQVEPPGRYGALALVVNTSASSPAIGLRNGFVQDSGTLGTRAAVSAATLVDEGTEEGSTVISSLLDSYKDDKGAGPWPLDIVLHCWSELLGAYCSGQHAVEAAVDEALNALPLAGASGLGSWAAGAFTEALSTLGLQPAKLGALKPVVVNTALVANSDDAPYLVHFLALKRSAIEHPLPSNDLFSSVISSVETDALKQIDGATIEIATISPLGEDGPTLPITIVLPEPLKDISTSFIKNLAATLRDLQASFTGLKVWE